MVILPAMQDKRASHLHSVCIHTQKCLSQARHSRHQRVLHFLLTCSKPVQCDAMQWRLPVRERLVFRYLSGEEMKIGDRVELRLWFWKTEQGTVEHVYDPTKPSGLHSENAPGYAIQLEDGSVHWQPVGKYTRRLRLLARGKSTSNNSLA